MFVVVSRLATLWAAHTANIEREHAPRRTTTWTTWCYYYDYYSECRRLRTGLGGKCYVLLDALSGKLAFLLWRTELFQCEPFRWKMYTHQRANEWRGDRTNCQSNSSASKLGQRPLSPYCRIVSFLECPSSQRDMKIQTQNQLKSNCAYLFKYSLTPFFRVVVCHRTANEHKLKYTQTHIFKYHEHN